MILWVSQAVPLLVELTYSYIQPEGELGCKVQDGLPTCLAVGWLWAGLLWSPPCGLIL